jgi:ABC-type uncharacterized transport system substrate-binding protein
MSWLHSRHFQCATLQALVAFSLSRLGADMRRRAFIALLGGATVTWPFAARAQQSKVRRIGCLLLGNADAESFRSELRDGLRKLGYVEGQNINFDFRSAEGNIDLLPKLAAELVALRLDVIVALYTRPVRSPRNRQRVKFLS